MPIRAVRIKLLGYLLLAIGTGFLSRAAAQSAAASAPGAPSAPSAPAAAPRESADPGSRQTPTEAGTALDYLYNRKPQEGSAAKDASDANRRATDRAIAQDALGARRIEDPQARTRFEKYLATTELTSDEIKAYGVDFTKVLELLRSRKQFEAWKQLYRLAEYERIDAGVSGELGNRIDSIWNADNTNRELARQNADLRNQIDTSSRNADFMAEEVRNDEIEYQRKLRDRSGRSRQAPSGGAPAASGGAPGPDGAPAAPTSMSDNLVGKLQLTEEYLKSLEAKANIKMNQLKAQKLFDKAKADFAEYITTLYNSHRYRHVLIAAEFWRRIFDEGEYPVAMAQQVNASLEINRDVQSAIDVFHTNLTENDIAAATDRLQEAFMTSEFHPAVLGLPREEKKKVEAFTKRLSKMQNLLEARDFVGLEQLLNELQTLAPDFDRTKPMAIINAVKLESQLRLGKARLAAQQGDLKQAMEQFQSAAEAWPANPELKDKALSFFNTQDVQNQTLVDFDRMVAEGNYRGIFDKQLAVAPALKDDPKRQEQLKAALEKVRIAETAVEKAAVMRANGDVFGAWESVEFAVKELPTDLKLNALRGELSGKAAEFVAAINKAKDAEARQELGYSLTWYAIAQRQYPASQIANEAIERLSKAILAQATP